MLKGLRTIVYHVNDLTKAKEWYDTIFGIAPYFDEPFYVGYTIGGFELGLDPDPTNYKPGNAAITYWGVDNIQLAFEKFIAADVAIHEPPKNVGGEIWLGSIYDPFGNVIGIIENPEFGI